MLTARLDWPCVCAAAQSGVSVKMVRHYELLGLSPAVRRASADVKRIAQAHVADLERRIAEMQAMRQTLAELAACCAGDSRPDCPILSGLAK